MEAIFAALESLFGGLFEPSTSGIFEQILGFVMDFLKTFALIG